MQRLPYNTDVTVMKPRNHRRIQKIVKGRQITVTNMQLEIVYDQVRYLNI